MSFQKFKNSLSKTILSLALTVAIIAGNLGSNLVLADFAAPSDPPDKQAILDIMNAYSPDVYHILVTEDNSGDDFMKWYQLSGSPNIINMLDTAVHETFHGYTWQNHRYYQESIYAGNGVDFLVDMQGAQDYMFPTSEMAATLPPELMTFRYDTYISSGSDASANTQGVFGLLNEFSAYYWGLNALYTLQPYFESYSSDYNLWSQYANSLGNNMNAYAEFKYWILNYLAFAKGNHPDAYNQIMNNQSFCQAYSVMEQQFANLISNNLNSLEGLNAMLGYSGIKLEYNGQSVNCYQNRSWRSTDTYDYTTLMHELENAELRQIDADLKAVGSGNLNSSPVQSMDAATKVKRISIGHFCERLYTAALNRDFDAAGKDYWTDQLIAGVSGADVAKQFFFSPEFINSKTSNAEFITRLYRTFMGREPDKDGLDYWIKQMNGGMSRESVFDGFINSPEWANVCEAYGIISGGIASPSLTAKPTDDIKDFATKLYTTCLGRMPEKAGLDYWAKELANHTKTGTMVAYGFFFSDEFTDAHYYNSEFVTRLYRTFMNREPDEDGFNYWVSQLEKGTARSDVFIGFAASPEFARLCDEANILN